VEDLLHTRYFTGIRKRAMHRRRKRTPELRQSRYIQPRLEALEDRFLPSGNPLGPTVTVTITSLDATSTPHQELVLPDGKILLGMTVGTGQSLGMPYSGTVPPGLIMGGTQSATAMELMRLNADGTLDTTFGNGGVDILRPDLSDSIANFAVAPDGSILVAGAEISSDAGYLVPSPVNWDSGLNAGSPGYDFVYQDSGLRVLRLSADGSIDSSFRAGNVPGFRVDSMSVDGLVGAVAIQADGKVVVAGEEEGFGNSTIFVARYNTDGSFDTTFNPGGVQPGVATTSITNPPVVVDPTHPLSGYAWGYGWISSVAVQSDGKIVVGGSQSADGGIVVLRYNADGSADTGFGSSGMVSYSAGPGELAYFGSLALQTDGKVVAEATLGALPGPVDNAPIGGLELVRLNTDGTFDSSFGQQGVVQFGTTANPLGPYTVYQPAFPFSASDAESPVQANLLFNGLDMGGSGLIVQADGKIVVAGGTRADQQAYADSPGFVARFNTDGSPDTSFGPNGVQFTTLVASPNAFEAVGPLAIGLAPDGSVLVVGMLDSGIRGLAGIPGWPYKVPYLTLLDFHDGTTGGGDTASPVAAPPAAAPTSNALSDAVFQLLASGGGFANGSVALPANTGLFDLPTTLPSTITPLPVPGVSQSAAVASLSGGGGGLGTAIDDPFALTGEPDRIGDLVLAGDANGPA
jgi:uncharacterized delta-60 repeat protein